MAARVAEAIFSQPLTVLQHRYCKTFENKYSLKKEKKSDVIEKAEVFNKQINNLIVKKNLKNNFFFS